MPFKACALITDGRFSGGSRKRNVSPALKAYAAFTTGVARGAVRDVEQTGSKRPN